MFGYFAVALQYGRFAIRRQGARCARTFSDLSPDATPCLFLKMRALFGLNARCDVLTYLALNRTGHPREVARELYYSQKAIHDVMTEMTCSGVVHSSRAAREHAFPVS
jgi:hypothetical protein